MFKICIYLLIIALFVCCNENPDKKPISTKVKVEFRLASENPTLGFEERELNGKKLYLNPRIEISEKEIAFVYQAKSQSGNPDIYLELNKEGTLKFASLTADNISKMLAIVVNGDLIMAPVIQTKIPGGKVQISGSFSESQIDSLLKNLTGI